MCNSFKLAKAEARERDKAVAEKLQAARGFLAKGVAPADIAEIIGLSIQEVEELV
jgi:hypothetical protein